MPKLSALALADLEAAPKSPAEVTAITKTVSAMDDVVTAREEVYEIIGLAVRGMPVVPTRVLAVLGEKYYRSVSSPTVVAGEAEAQYPSRKHALDACALHVRSAIGVLAKMRQERDAEDPTADLQQIADAYRTSIEVLSQKMVNERETRDRRGIAYLASELRETLAEASAFFGRPIDKKVTVTGKVSHEHSGEVVHRASPADAYSAWNGSASDLVALDADFVEEEQ